MIYCETSCIGQGSILYNTLRLIGLLYILSFATGQYSFSFKVSTRVLNTNRPLQRGGKSFLSEKTTFYILPASINYGFLQPPVLTMPAPISLCHVVPDSTGQSHHLPIVWQKPSHLANLPRACYLGSKASVVINSLHQNHLQKAACSYAWLQHLSTSALWNQ